MKSEIQKDIQQVRNQNIVKDNGAKSISAPKIEEQYNHSKHQQKQTKTGVIISQFVPRMPSPRGQTNFSSMISTKNSTTLNGGKYTTSQKSFGATNRPSSGHQK